MKGRKFSRAKLLLVSFFVFVFVSCSASLEDIEKVIDSSPAKSTYLVRVAEYSDGKVKLTRPFPKGTVIPLELTGRRDLAHWERLAMTYNLESRFDEIEKSVGDLWGVKQVSWVIEEFKFNKNLDLATPSSTVSFWLASLHAGDWAGCDRSYSKRIIDNYELDRINLFKEISTNSDSYDFNVVNNELEEERAVISIEVKHLVTSQWADTTKVYLVKDNGLWRIDKLKMLNDSSPFFSLGG